jgi:DNA-binding NtrC family response regulator
VVRYTDGGATEQAIERLREAQALSRFIGDAGCFLDIVARLPLLARTDASVVISGETGTGKELAARALHYLGSRAERPFVPVNCGSLPDNLLEDELFGHERGAFTDARSRRAGLIVQAHGGTLFLDEVDSLTPRAQVALLRVLQDRTIRALGAERVQIVDVRFIAATNAELMTLVHAGSFRSDLYYRINVINLTLPPLRERGDDVILLARHFLRHFNTDESRRFVLTAEAEDALRAHRWPGNVRELENTIQRAIAFAASREITPGDLGLAGSPAPGVTASSWPLGLNDQPFRDAKRAVVEAFEREYVSQLLRSSGGNVTRAAQSAHKERRDFGRLIRKYELDPQRFS